MSPSGRELRIVLVEDDAENASIAIDALGAELPSGRPIAVQHVSDFAGALEALEVSRPDIFILDVLDRDENENMGEMVLEQLRGVLFAPVIFYTANESLVDAQQTEFVRLVKKTDGAIVLRDLVYMMADSRLGRLRDSLGVLADTALARFMWQFAEAHWGSMSKLEDAQLESVMARALAAQLSKMIPGAEGPVVAEEDVADPLFFYNFTKPVADKHYSGEILQDTDGEIYVLLSPSCRMHRQGPDLGCILAHCRRLEHVQECVEYSAHPSAATKNRLSLVLKNSVAERHFLPQAVTMPASVVEFTQLTVRPQKDLSTMAFLAQVASPYSEALAGRFAAYFGTIGTPALPVDDLLGSFGHPPMSGAKST